MALVDGQDLAEVLDLDYATYDDALDQVAEAADDIVGALLTTAAYAAEPAACKEAALSVAAEIWQARTASGGQAVSVDFTPGPYRLSVWLTRRVNALIGPYMKVTGMVG
jgi:malate/lactate dehydrogenase